MQCTRAVARLAGGLARTAWVCLKQWLYFIYSKHGHLNAPPSTLI